MYNIDIGFDNLTAYMVGLITVGSKVDQYMDAFIAQRVKLQDLSVIQLSIVLFMVYITKLGYFNEAELQSQRFLQCSDPSFVLETF